MKTTPFTVDLLKSLLTPAERKDTPDLERLVSVPRPHMQLALLASLLEENQDTRQGAIDALSNLGANLHVRGPARLSPLYQAITQQKHHSGDTIHHLAKSGVELNLPLAIDAPVNTDNPIFATQNYTSPIALALDHSNVMGFLALSHLGSTYNANSVQMSAAIEPRLDNAFAMPLLRALAPRGSFSVSSDQLELCNVVFDQLCTWHQVKSVRPYELDNEQLVNSRTVKESTYFDAGFSSPIHTASLLTVSDAASALAMPPTKAPFWIPLIALPTGTHHATDPKINAHVAMNFLTEHLGRSGPKKALALVPLRHLIWRLAHFCNFDAKPYFPPTQSSMEYKTLTAACVHSLNSACVVDLLHFPSFVSSLRLQDSSVVQHLLVSATTELFDHSRSFSSALHPKQNTPDTAQANLSRLLKKQTSVALIAKARLATDGSAFAALMDTCVHELALCIEHALTTRNTVITYEFFEKALGSKDNTPATRVFKDLFDGSLHHLLQPVGSSRDSNTHYRLASLSHLVGTALLQGTPKDQQRAEGLLEFSHALYLSIQRPSADALPIGVLYENAVLKAALIKTELTPEGPAPLRI